MAEPQNTQDIRLGSAAIDRTEPVQAGSYTTITLTYTAGHPVDDTGYLMICFRQVTDFGRPQFADPTAPNYCSVRTSGDCQVTPRWDPKGYTRPWGKAVLIQVSRGYLAAGETITVTFGDRSGGSPGWQMQTFAERTFEFKVLVDPIATYQFKEMPDSPVISVVAGPAARTTCIAPSQVAAGQPFVYHVKRDDCWGNPVGEPERFRHGGLSKPGVERLSIIDAVTGALVTSNPIEVRADAAAGALSRYWGDLHGQSEETVGTNSIEDYFRFGRDFALLDAVAHQGNDFQVTDEFWATINDVSRRFDAPGRLVTYPGYEWSGNTPLGGDRNVYFVNEGGAISHSCTDLLPGKATAHPIAPTADDLFRNLRASPVRSFAFAHVGGRYADIAMHDEDIEPAVEIHSAWGTFEWLLEDALRKGYRVGVVANSDDHKCRPGASYPGAGDFGSLGGLTCFLADKLDREGLFEALIARRCYATTGNRPLLSVRLTTDDGRAAEMGEILRAGTETVLRVAVSGTAPVESISVRNGLREIAILRPGDAQAGSSRIKLIWRGAEVRGRARMTRWDGHLEVAGNRIVDVTPVNFWNAHWPLRREGEGRVAWRSTTTGGLAGMILDLAEPAAGQMRVMTAQGEFALDVAAIGVTPTAFSYGGVGKQLEVYRLPASGKSVLDCSAELPLAELAEGDNPIYVRITQEDGHMAWSSPIYIIR